MNSNITIILFVLMILYTNTITLRTTTTTTTLPTKERKNSVSQQYKTKKPEGVVQLVQQGTSVVKCIVVVVK